MVTTISGGRLQRVLPSAEAASSLPSSIAVADPGEPLLSRTDLSPKKVWEDQPAVRKVVDFVARNIASIPWQVFDRVGDTDRRRVTDHPLARVLRAPAPGITPYRMWHGLLVDWLLHDRWCAVKTPAATFGELDLLRVPAGRARFLADPLGRVKVISVDGNDLTPAAFVYDHGYAPYGAGSVSPMRTLRAVLEESAEAVAYRRSIWKNGARVPLVLKRPADANGKSWDPVARERFTRSWQAFTRGGGREGGTPILEDGMEAVKIDAFSARDTQDLQGRQLTEVEVASAFHIPPELVGARAGTYSNVESFREALYRDALGPYIVAIEQVVNTMLVPELDAGGSLYAEMNVEAKLRGSFEEQARVLSTAVGGPWMLRSEARARANLPPIEGADELIVPLNVVEGGLASPRDTAPDTT